MTTFVVPCGLSVLDGLVKGPVPTGARVGTFRDAVAGWQQAAEALPDDQVVASWMDEVGQAADDARLPDWDPKPLSAETHTLTKSTGLGRLSRLPGEGHRVVLLASQTPEGVGAAMTVAYHLADDRPDRVGYLTTAQDDTVRALNTSLLGKPVTVARIQGLNATPEGMHRATVGIGRILRAALNLGGEVEVQLSGGYKATLLHTLAMTEVLHSLAPDRVRARYIFEGPDSALVPIALRTFHKEYRDLMVKELRAVRDGTQVPSRPSFEGIAWAATTGGKPSLNDFGRGYLAVLEESLTRLPSDGGR
jgi:hypothetical protein